MSIVLVTESEQRKAVFRAALPMDCRPAPPVEDALAEVAEHTMLLILAAARLRPAGSMHSGTWAPPVGIELARRPLAIIGCGAIGRATARIARRGFRRAVVGFRRRPFGPTGGPGSDPRVGSV